MSIFDKIKQYLSGQSINKDFEQEKPENWIWGVIYFNKRDHRFLVAKRNPMMGWTFNFAHPIAFVILVLILSMIVFQSTTNS